MGIFILSQAGVPAAAAQVPVRAEVTSRTVRISSYAAATSRGVVGPVPVVRVAVPSAPELRVAQLLGLQAGWHDGQGEPVDPEAADDLLELLRHVGDALPTPRIFPLPDGGLRAEWLLGTTDLSVELVDGEYYAHVLDLATGLDDDLEVHDMRTAGKFLLDRHP